MYIVVTDCEYRAAVSLVYALGAAGHTLILCHASDMAVDPPAFHSRYAATCHEIPAGVGDPAYLDALETICRACPEMPVLLPVGAKTTALIAREQARFETFAKTLVAAADVLDAANDKEIVRRIASEIGVPTPKTYTGMPDAFPVIVKPRCGEKLGLKAEARYIRADNAAAFSAAYAKMKRYDDAPVVQACIEGEGVGVCVVTDRDGAPAAVLCHRRVREYPISGGPSTACESFYDAALADSAIRLLRALHFVGVAMVEFKGDAVNGYKLLEINPRVWGSFPMTLASKSRFAEIWAQAAAGARFDAPNIAYLHGKRMYFLLNDAIACLALLKKRRFGAAFGGIRDLFSPRACEALYRRDDPKPFFFYLKNALKRGRKA